MKIKDILISLGVYKLVFIIFGGMMFWMSVPDTVISFKPAVSFEEILDGEEVKAGDHVAGNVPYALGYFASKSTYTRYQDGSRSGDRKAGNYYMIPTAEGYIGLKTPQSDVAAMDDLSDETFEYLTSGTEPTTEVYMEGSVEVMKDNLAGYFKEYLEEMGYTKEEIEEMGEPLMIEYVNYTASRVMTALSVVVILLMVFLTWREYKKEMARRERLSYVEDIPDMGDEQF